MNAEQREARITPVGYDIKADRVHGTEILEHQNIASILTAVRRESPEGRVFLYRGPSLQLTDPVDQDLSFISAAGFVHYYYGSYISEYHADVDTTLALSTIKSTPALPTAEGEILVDGRNGDTYSIYQTNMPETEKFRNDQLETWCRDVGKRDHEWPGEGVIKYVRGKDTLLADYVVANSHLVTYFPIDTDFGSLEKEHFPGIRKQDITHIIEDRHGSFLMRYDLIPQLNIT